VGGGSETYNVQYKLASAENWTDVASDTDETSFTLTGLTPLTAYDVRAQSVCDGGATSDWRTASFTTTAEAEEVGDSWSDNFEGDACGWELINGTCTNAWAWGTATKSGGTHALYISNDGGTTYTYTNNMASMVYATKILNFVEGKYEFAYDWIANGESTYDYLRVALVPATMALTAGTSAPSGFGYSTLPSGWIALDGGGKLNQSLVWQSKSVAVNVAAGNYYLVVAWRNDTSSGTIPPAAIDNVSITKIACSADVENLSVDNITTTSATITWTAGEATQWQVAYSATNNIDDATKEIVDAATYDIINLQPDNHYYAWVRAYCGGEDFGAWSDVLQFNTECVTIAEYPWSENFDSYTAGTGVLPNCWSSINTTTNINYSSYPYIQNSTGYSESNCLRLYSFYYSNGSTTSDPQPQYAILPAMENLAGKQITLKAKGSTSSSTFKIGMMTDPTDASTFTSIAEQALTTSYEEYEYMIPTNAADAHVAIMIDAATSARSTNGVYIDDITIGEPPSCVKPTALTYSDVTGHTVALSWTPGIEGQTAWDVEYATDADFSENATLVENVDSHENYEITGLAPETTYYVRVRANCGGGDVSQWGLKTVSFTTTVACPAPTNLVATPGNYGAQLKWEGYSDSYTVCYRTAAYAEGLVEAFNKYGVPSGWARYSGLVDDVIAGDAELNTTTSGWNTTSYALGEYNMKLNIYGTSVKYWLVTPEFNLSQNLSFVLALTDYNNADPIEDNTQQADDRFVVLIYADDAWHILREWNNSGSEYVYNAISTTGENVTIDLSDYYGQDVKIAFYGESTVGDNGDNDLHIDNVVCGIPYEAGEWQTITVDEPATTIPELTPETAYDAKVQGDCGEEGLSIESSIISFTTLVECPNPMNVEVSEMNGNSATVTWEGYNDSYNVSYRTAAYVDGIYEEFNTSGVPAGWTRYSGLVNNVIAGDAELTTTSLGWNTTSYALGQYNMKLNIYGVYSKYWLVSPEFNLSQNLSFDLALTDYGNADPIEDPTAQADDRFVVLIYADEAWHILREWNNSGSDYVYNTISYEGETVTINLSAYYGQNVKIAFYGESTVGDNGDNDLHIDNVVCGIPYEAGEWQTIDTDESSISLTDLTPGTDYEVKVQGICDETETGWSEVATFSTTPTPVEITLANNATTNAATIAGYSGEYANVTLGGRTLYKNGNWNTLCLPFNVTLAGSPLAGAEARELVSASIEGTTLNLTFNDHNAAPVTTLTAGTPYIIRWGSGDDLTETQLVFNGVTISKTMHDFSSGSGDTQVRFLGTYDAISFDQEGFTEDKSILFLGEGNTLYYPLNGAFIGACRAYFKIGEDGSDARLLTAFNLNFGDEQTAIREIDTQRLDSGSYYDLNGRRLNKKPTRRGVYIFNGQKLVVK
jgi:hypothetical protein